MEHIMKTNFIRVNRVMILLAFVFVSASAVNIMAVENIPETEIIILGGLHGMHKQNPKYSPVILRDVIVGTAPAAVLSELPEIVLGEPAIVNRRINDRLVPGISDENWSANAAADILNIPVIAYDRADRNENFIDTNYFERMDALYKNVAEWLSDKKNTESFPTEAAMLGSLSDRLLESQTYFSLNAGPEIVNSRGFDDLIRVKHEISDELLPGLSARTPSLGNLAGEFAFLRDQWDERNRIMADNIIAQARKFQGKRLVVICGVDHKYALRDLLSKIPSLKILEYYEAGSPNHGYQK